MTWLGVRRGAWLLPLLATVPIPVVAGEGSARPVVGSTYQGWIAFGREFQLYERRQDVGRKYDRSCYSGIVDTLARHRKAARFDGRYVRIVASPVAAADYFKTGLAERAENYCARDVILVAHSIAPASPPARAP